MQSIIQAKTYCANTHGHMHTMHPALIFNTYHITMHSLNASTLIHIMSVTTHPFIVNQLSMTCNSQMYYKDFTNLYTRGSFLDHTLHGV
jgi:hypothetical protein